MNTLGIVLLVAFIIVCVLLVLLVVFRMMAKMEWVVF